MFRSIVDFFGYERFGRLYVLTALFIARFVYLGATG